MNLKLSEKEIKDMLYKKWNEKICDDIYATDIEQFTKDVVSNIIENKFNEIYEFVGDVERLFVKSSIENVIGIFKEELTADFIEDALKIALANRLSELSFDELKELINNVKK